MVGDYKTPIKDFHLHVYRHVWRSITIKPGDGRALLFTIFSYPSFYNTNEPVTDLGLNKSETLLLFGK
jgi:hypothetical protein